MTPITVNIDNATGQHFGNTVNSVYDSVFGPCESEAYKAIRDGMEDAAKNPRPTQPQYANPFYAIG